VTSSWSFIHQELYLFTAAENCILGIGKHVVIPSFSPDMCTKQ